MTEARSGNRGAGDLPDDATIAREAGTLGGSGPTLAAGAGGGTGGGINGAELMGHKDALGGTGGSAGGGTIAGGGDPSGVNIGAAGSLAGLNDDLAGHSATTTAQTGGLGEALGSGAGRDIGSGTPGDRGELGGGGSDALTR